MTSEFYDIWRTVLIDSCRMFNPEMLYRFSDAIRQNADRAIQVMALEAILERYKLIPECLPTCDETHDEDCPRLAAEAEYWRQYFAVGTPAFWNFAPEGIGVDQ